ncbi:Presumed portal vertex protein, partial [Salmonella enterica]|nr:Presumed portal vertex protein [Salmonella enterica]
MGKQKSRKAAAQKARAPQQLKASAPQKIEAFTFGEPVPVLDKR